MTETTGPDEPLACAVCGRVLDYHRMTGTWEHVLGDLLDEDHPAVPVPLSEIPEQLRPRCDFCSADYPGYVLPVSPFTSGIYQWDDSWAACAECAALIERNQWNGVLRRSKANSEAKHGPMTREEEAHLRALHRDVRKHICGAIRKDA